jgi:phage/plasmid-associated DNA primase
VLENVRNLKKPEIGENVRVGPTNQTDLFRARFVPSIEIENGRRFAARLVKQLTGGNLIKARRMREDMWEFEPTHIVIVAANHKPEVRGTDKGIWRRIKVVPWTVSIPEGERNRNLPVELAAELEGILAWAVRGAVEWYQHGLEEPAEVRAETDAYQKDMDVLASFIFERCVEGPGITAVSSQLFKAWEMWCRDNNEDPGTQKKFSGRLMARGYEKEQATAAPHKGKMVWHGIGVRSEDDGPDGGPEPPQPGPVPDSGRESRVEPSTPSQPSTNPLPEEKGLDKPNSGGGEGESRGLSRKKGLTAELPTRICELTGKTLYTLYYPLPDSLLEFQKAVDDLKGGSR